MTPRKYFAWALVCIFFMVIKEKKWYKKLRQSCPFFDNSLLDFFATIIKLLTSLVTFHYFCKNFDLVDEYIH